MTDKDLLMARLQDGAGKPCLFLPFLGEFGHEVMSHLRIVHFHQASEKVVCCRDGNEVLYPSASEYVTNWVSPFSDRVTVGTMRLHNISAPRLEGMYPNHQPIMAGKMTMVQEMIAINPLERIPFRPNLRGLKVDVVLGVRNRRFAPVRNWDHWQMLANSLTAHGSTFAVMGVRETSQDLIGQMFHTGDLDTDAAIELLQNCRLYVGTDSGGSHLASTVGADMLLFRETASESRDMTARMAVVNPGRVELVKDGWRSPGEVVRAVLERLKS